MLDRVTLIFNGHGVWQSFRFRTVLFLYLKRPIETVLPALIHNPNSRRNHHEGDSFLKIAREMLGELCICSQHDEHLIDHIRRLHQKEVDVIAINGGDGTVSACLTAIAAVYPEENLPGIVIFPSGNTNLIAGDVGFGARGVEGLKALLSGREFKENWRSPLRLSWPEAEKIPLSDCEEGGLLAVEAEENNSVLGMFGGCTGYARAVRIAHSPTVLRFAPHDLAVFLTIFTSVASLLFRKTRQKWLYGNAMSWQAFKQSEAGKEVCFSERTGRSFFFLVTSLGKISHGIWPFWRDSAQKDRRFGFHFLDVHAFPENLLVAIANLLRGRAPFWLRSHKDYTSDFAERMEIRTDSDFVLDGEVFKSGESGRIFLERGPVFRFLRQ